jgi:hypothetical protein
MQSPKNDKKVVFNVGNNLTYIVDTYFQNYSHYVSCSKSRRYCFNIIMFNIILIQAEEKVLMKNRVG